MKLIIKDNSTAKEWDGFIQSNAGDGGWLQAWAWGEFQTKNSRKIWRLAIFAGPKILLQTLVVKQRLPLGKSYFYLPRGPVLAKGLASQTAKESLDFLWRELAKLAKTEKAIFLRLDPPWDNQKKLVEAGFKSVGSVQPASTLILDLALNEQELLKQMKAKTRYNIKVAEKHGVKIRKAVNADFESFWQLLVQTAQRDRIKTHAEGYYRKMLEIPGIGLALAEIDGRIIAGAIIADFGDWRIYLHGASDYQSREKMAPYALQWQLIKDARQAGRRFYDFWGADEKKWPGVTRFKVGFAPATELRRYIGAYDRPFKKFWYALYNLLKNKL